MTAPLAERVREPPKHDYALGTLFALAVLRDHGSHVQAVEIADQVGMKCLRAAARHSGAGQDRDTLRWVRTGKT